MPSSADARGRDTWAAAISAITPGFRTELLTGRVRTTVCPADHVLLRAWAVAGGIWLLRDGAARLFYFRRGRERIGDFFVAGDSCTDYSSLATRTPGRRWITTIGPTVVAERPRAAVEDAAHHDRIGVERLRRIVAERLAVEFAQTIWSSLMDSPAERYRVLQRTRPVWFERLPQYMIASYLGLSPEGLSKLRKRIRADDCTSSMRAGGAPPHVGETSFM